MSKISELTELSSPADDDLLPAFNTSAATPAAKNVSVKFSTLKTWLQSALAFLANPMTTLGDLIAGGSGGAAQRLAVGSDDQVLTVVSGQPAWADNAALSNPMTAAGDIILGGASGAPQRLAAGADDQVLTLVSGAPAWADNAALTNPMTTSGDLITGGTSGAPQRLAVGANGQVLKLVGGAPAWDDESAATALTNPMTASGDIIVGGTSGAVQRLGKGTDGHVLTLVSGAPAWTDAAALTNPMTASGDLIVGGTSGAPQRLGKGTDGHVLKLVSGAPAWTAETGGSDLDNLTATSAPAAGDDSADGYSVGSLWVWAARGLAWICVDASTGAALWRLLGITQQSILIAGTGESPAFEDTIECGFTAATGRLVDVRYSVAYLPSESPYLYTTELYFGESLMVTMTGISTATRSASEHSATIAGSGAVTAGQLIKVLVSDGQPLGLHLTLTYAPTSL